jgi:long-chain alkane monooxygenase
MTQRKFHLGWFVNFRPTTWTGPWAGQEARSWTNGRYYVDMAKALERACFDYIMLEDAEQIPDYYGGTLDGALKNAVGPRLDPVPLLSLMSGATSHLGLIGTMSTSFYPPFMVARSMATLDHLSAGRIGWNIVTSSEHRAAQNFGLDQLYEHDLRYDMADEFVDVVTRLWDSWEPGALVADQETGVYVDYTKVHAIDHAGRFFKCRGPLTTLPSPQGRPVLCQAGSSSRGRDFAARYAETILAVPNGLDSMRAFREDIRGRMKAAGRDPDSCKILFIVEPVLGETTAEARSRLAERFTDSEAKVEAGLISMSSLTDIDFSQFDWDQPLTAGLTTNGHQSSLANFYTYGSTLREIAVKWLNHYVDETMVGTPDAVADRMGEVMEHVGGDGFLITGPRDRRYVGEITDGLVPALQRRGLTRTEYTHRQLRDTLLEF